MWPLSISPMEQKIPKSFEQENKITQSTSAVKSENHPIEMARNIQTIEFKKKKVFDNPSPLASTNPSTPKTNRFAPVKFAAQTKFNDKDETLQMPSFKSRPSTRPSR